MNTIDWIVKSWTLAIGEAIHIPFTPGKATCIVQIHCLGEIVNPQRTTGQENSAWMSLMKPGSQKCEDLTYPCDIDPPQPFPNVATYGSTINEVLDDAVLNRYLDLFDNDNVIHVVAQIDGSPINNRAYGKPRGGRPEKKHHATMAQAIAAFQEIQKNRVQRPPFVPHK
jgi:hypothetical protein